MAIVPLVKIIPIIMEVTQIAFMMIVIERVMVRIVVVITPLLQMATAVMLKSVGAAIHDKAMMSMITVIVAMHAW